VDNGVEVIGHQTKLQDAGLGMIVVDVEVAEERLAVRGDERQVVDADAAPCSSIFLPMPRICHRFKIQAQRYNKKMTYANLYAIFDAEVHEETSKKQSIFFVE